jgi:DHA1 family tetracycline resistance protein-like MFS transporter
MSRRLDSRVGLLAFASAAAGAGAARGLTTTYLPVLLTRIRESPALIAAVMTVNAVAGLLVPLVVGAWSDRGAAGDPRRRLRFMLGGSAVACGGLLIIGLGLGCSSYLGLAVGAAAVYTGVNALTTVHRALVADAIDAQRRAKATGAQEIVAVAGAAAATVIGMLLVARSPGLAFLLAAALVPASAAPTLALVRRLGARHGAPPPRQQARLRSAFSLPGAREVLLAQALWSLAYAALPTFFVLYAHQQLGVGVVTAGALSLVIGLAIPLGMLLGARIREELTHRVLVLGATTVGLGLASAGLTSAMVPALLALSAAGLGAGLLATLGFPYFARFIPAGEAGSYSGAFYAARGIAGTAAVPLAGLAVQLTGSYRSVLVLGITALLAVPPLLAAERRNALVSAPVVGGAPA